MGYRLLHWGPLFALSVIAIISLSSFMCIIEWWPVTSTPALLNFIVFILLNIFVLYNFFLAALVGPGYVPLGWKPVSINLRYIYVYSVLGSSTELVDRRCCLCKMLSVIGHSKS